MIRAILASSQPSAQVEPMQGTNAAARQLNRPDICTQQVVTGRRQALLCHAAPLVAAGLVQLPVGASQASIIGDYLKDKLRPDMDPLEAVIKILDARGTLLELEKIAATPQDSELRFRTRALLPGFARRLRDVGPAAPVVSSLATGSSRDAAVSAAYGGEGSTESSPVDPVYAAIGQILNFSGRGLNPEALAGPELAAAGVVALEDLLARLPTETIERAQQLRADARAERGN